MGCPPGFFHSISFNLLHREGQGMLPHFYVNYNKRGIKALTTTQIRGIINLQKGGEQVVDEIIKDTLEIAKDLLEILVLILTARQLVKENRKKSKSNRRKR